VCGIAYGAIMLLDDKRLENSSVVANSMMNRQRGCLGGNSYQKELSLNPIEFLTSRLSRQKDVCWLDLCCGSGKALIEASHHFYEEELASKVQIIGVDLVAMFDSYPAEFSFLQLQEAAVNQWQASTRFDLITCVHGLHYVGDKLTLLQNACNWLKQDGIFLTNIDLQNLHSESGKAAGKQIVRALKSAGVEYNAKKRLIICKGRKEFDLTFNYIGADDKAGPNYTGQAAVNSYYRL
jgi:SAM-dependent methyltransferase